MKKHSVPVWREGLAQRLQATVRWWWGTGPSVVTLAVLSFGLSACGRNDVTRVLLQSRQTAESDVARVEILAQISGPQAGLRYKWYAVAGDCTPQESDWPTTVFRFAAGSVRDRVTVEVLRDGAVVAEESLDVALDEERAQVQRELVPEVKINLADVPPYDPNGGPDTRADIGGTVTGQIEPGYRIVVYARADAWYIQPIGGAQHPIRPDNSWKTWTHTGSSYAVLVVRPGYDPFARLDALPQLGGYVVGRTVVDGKTQ